jgi:sirohydrochlorin ferrochelatase
MSVPGIPLLRPGKAPLAVIVSHGQPSDPAPPEATLAALAAEVAAHLPGWTVRSATLAQPGALAAACAGADCPVVYPLFMADGWFTRTHLPARLAEAGAIAPLVLAPFGMDPAVQELTVQLVREALARGQGHEGVLLAAHGSFRSAAPADVARAVAGRIAAETGLAPVVPAFIDQEPRIAEAARDFGPGSICLPFFAAAGDHVSSDLPEALAEAGFRGQVLSAVGLDPRVPPLIAQALRAAASATSATDGVVSAG